MPGDRGTYLPPTVLRGIGDKLYDKRKSAALEVEQLVKTLAAQVPECMCTPRHMLSWTSY